MFCSPCIDLHDDGDVALDDYINTSIDEVSVQHQHSISSSIRKYFYHLSRQEYHHSVFTSHNNNIQWTQMTSNIFLTEEVPSLKLYNILILKRPYILKYIQDIVHQVKWFPWHTFDHS